MHARQHTHPVRRWAAHLVAVLAAVTFTASWLSAIPAQAAGSSTVTVGTCDEAALRAAVAAAAPGDTVELGCGGTITLTAVGGGPLVLSKDLTIDGGLGGATLSGGGATGVIEISAGVTATLTNLTITDGGSGTGSYGGVLNDGTLSVLDSTFTNNTGSTGGAGAIANHGTLHVLRSTFRANNGVAPQALSAGVAGAIYDSVSAQLDVTESSFANNTATGVSSAGGIYSAAGIVTVTSSTFTANSAVQVGAVAANGGSLAVTNSTFSGNLSAYWADGVESTGALSVSGLASATVTNSTVTGNVSVCDSNCSPGSGAGGIFAALDGTQVRLTNTVLAGNLMMAGPYTNPAPGNCGPLAITDEGGNLSDDGTCGAGVTQTSAAALDLAPLTDNGGPTQTVALGAGSIAIDAGSCLQTTDQRGQPRPGAGGTGCDAGAYEFQAQADTDLTLAGMPGDIVVDATGPSGAIVTYTSPTALDETGDASPATVDCTPASGASFPIGTSTVTCTATDPDDTAASATFTVTVTAAPTTLTGVAGSGSFGGTATLTATLSAGGVAVPGETVSFTVTGSGVGSALTDSNGVATVSGIDLTGIAAGSFPDAVGASFAGDASHAGTSGSGALTVDQGDQTITFGALPTPSYGDPSLDLSGAATASSGLPVSLVSLTAAVCTTSGPTGSTVSLVGAGTCTVQASQDGGTDYAPAPHVQASFTVTPAALTVTAGSPTVTYSGSAPTIAPSYDGFVNGETSAALGTGATCGSSAPSDGAAGTYPTSCAGASDPNYLISYLPGTLTITPATIPVTVTGSQTFGSSNPVFTATAAPPAGVTLEGTASCTTVDNGVAIDAALTGDPHTIDGGSCSGVTPSDAVDYVIAYTGGAFAVQQSVTSLVYSGDQTVAVGSNLTPAALLASPAAGCLAGQVVRFTLDSDPTTVGGSASLGSAMTTGDGTASLGVISTSGWAEGVYTITATFAGTPSCASSSDQATLTVAAPGDAATGGGWYTLSGSGRVNLGFVAHLVAGTSGTYTGQLLLINSGKWRLKGALTSYVQTDGQGSVSGTGDLYWWDTSLNDGLGDWALAASGVDFAASFTATTSSGGKHQGRKSDGPGSFGIHVDYLPTDPQPTSLPNSTPVPLKHGDITVT